MEFAARQRRRLQLRHRQHRPAAVNPLLSKVPYSMDRDFIPVTLISSGPNVLVVNTPGRSIAGRDPRIRARQSRQAVLRHQRPGQRLAPEHRDAKNLTKANIVEIPYKGGVLAVQDLLGQQIISSSPTRCRRCSTSAPASCARCAPPARRSSAAARAADCDSTVAAWWL